MGESDFIILETKPLRGGQLIQAAILTDLGSCPSKLTEALQTKGHFISSNMASNEFKDHLRLFGALGHQPIGPNSTDVKSALLLT